MSASAAADRGRHQSGMVVGARPSVIIVINALHSGGAEKTCVELARHLRESRDVQVVGLLAGGPTERELRALGVSVSVPRASSGTWVKLRVLVRLVTLMRSSQPTAVITFLYAADFVAGTLARILLPRTEVFWNIRCNVLPPNRMGVVSRWCSRINALLSPLIPSAIVYCSALSRQQHEGRGYRSRRSYVVENSPTAVPFVFDANKRAAFRREPPIREFAFLFVGRFDPVKRVDVFIEACARVERALPGGARFLLAGRGMEAGNPQLRALLDEAALTGSCELLGYVADQQALYSAADCLVVTSESEGSPNVVYEAMATRLHVLILATTGTEAITGSRVHRLQTRCIADLAEAMTRLVTAGIPEDATRLPQEGTVVATEHPLVGFYRSVLAA